MHPFLSIHFVALFLVATSFALVLPPVNDPIETRDAAPARKVCSYSGNGDIYGLGIRLGLYLQWFAGWLSGFLEGEGAKASVDILCGHVVFCIAIFLALVTRDPSSSTPLDVVILFFMFFGGAYAVLLAVQAHGRSKDAESQAKKHKAVMHSFLIIWYGTLLYASWFWWKGIHVLFQTEKGETEKGKTEKEESAPEAEVAQWVHNYFPGGPKFFKIYIEIISLENKRFNAFCSFAFIVYTINAIELMLAWNEVTDINQVDSIGQLFPLIVGVVILIDLLMNSIPEGFISKKMDGVVKLYRMAKGKPLAE
ncbi:hypothetical protein BDZ45DRAFT_793307 [Acephala macrosclerotiorum]|nr:hypothetical protein BDZ45DRAFT_793307 [Acephala macrosclerotiorum]